LLSSDGLLPITSTTVVVVPITALLENDETTSELAEVTLCVVNGVKACRAEKVPVKASFFSLLGAFCGLAGLPIVFCNVDPLMLEDLENVLGAMVETGAHIDGDGGVGAGSNPPDPLEFASDPTSLSVGEGKSLKKKPLGENGLFIGL